MVLTTVSMKILIEKFGSTSVLGKRQEINKFLSRARIQLEVEVALPVQT